MNVNLPDPLIWSLAISLVLAVLFWGVTGLVRCFRPQVTPAQIQRLEARIDTSDALTEMALHSLSQALWIASGPPAHPSNESYVQQAPAQELLPGEIAELLLQIIRTPATRRTEEQFWFIRDHWSLEWCLEFMARPDVGKDKIEALARGSRQHPAPDDIRQQIRQTLEEASVVNRERVPDDPSGLGLTDTAYMRVVTGEDLADAAT